MWKFSEILFFSFFVSVALAPLFRFAAFQIGVLDYPKHYGIHQQPVPRLGGLSIFIAFVMGALYRMDLSQMLKGVLVGSSIIFIVGLLDDLVHLKASIKLTAQVLACGIMMFQYGVILETFPNMWINAFFTTLGVIGITNAVNFLDNMDGLAGGLVAISSLAIFAVSWITHQVWLGYLSMALAGAALGFLVFNLKKAYFFMGDSGSTFLGFTLASLTVMCEWSRYLPVTLAVPILILGVPILDMFLITVLRIKEDKVRTIQEWIDYTGKDHLSHRMMRLGLGERGAVFAVWALEAFFCAAALFVLLSGPLGGILGLGFYFLTAAGVILLFRKRRSLLLSVNQRSPRRKQKRRFPVKNS